MSARRIKLVLGTAGAFLAAGLIPLATSPAAHASCIDDAVGCDPDFISATDPLLKMFGITEIGAADPDTNFEGMILNIPSLGITRRADFREGHLGSLGRVGDNPA